MKQKKADDGKCIQVDGNSAAAWSVYSRHDGISSEEVNDNILSEQLELLKTSFYTTKVVITE